MEEMQGFGNLTNRELLVGLAKDTSALAEYNKQLTTEMRGLREELQNQKLALNSLKTKATVLVSIGGFLVPIIVSILTKLIT